MTQMRSAFSQYQGIVSLIKYLFNEYSGFQIPLVFNGMRGVRNSRKLVPAEDTARSDLNNLIKPDSIYKISLP